jgi:putative membrane protein
VPSPRRSPWVALDYSWRSFDHHPVLGTAFAILVAVAHVAFMVLETFMWTTPAVRKRFGQTAEQAEATRVLAANQGVYNGALAGALLWSVATGQAATTTVLLAFVVVVGVYGAYSAKRSILFIQALPAALALTFVQLGM